MGILSWWKSKPTKESNSTENKQNSDSKLEKSTEIPGLNGAMEVPRPADVTVFEFGSAKASSDKVTVAGYCPVSEELEPCRWEILPATGSNPPQFRVVF
ncbi:Allyl alcohol dehydrogenase-like protein [Thalictrum thalictroides]|uniref:Allyl alcohol dehydrogenase-like protein n=1 Tax=Thalictrum thalictroides TaxID=46969 RepID=A0A7J6VGM1_THATH|nr:Allyl alcohol dehydrogenase-like protein [Thalictrum thalictroides]